MSQENVEVGCDTRVRTFVRHASGRGIPNLICLASRRGTLTLHLGAAVVQILGAVVVQMTLAGPGSEVR
jgi:hypothetical protein